MGNRKNAKEDVMQAQRPFVAFVEQHVDVLAIVTLDEALQRVAARIAGETDEIDASDLIPPN